MNLLDLDLALPVLGAVLAGGLIGAEREYRSSPAGFRTHILVSLSCALLMLAAVHQIRWLSDTPDDLIRIDPVRMAHGVLTGIGFLCGGVIFREGLNVRGLTTAASLWMTSSLGVLFGVGFYSLAIGGTLVTLGVLAAVAASERLLPQQRFARIMIRYRRSDVMSERDFRASLSRFGLVPSVISQRLKDGYLELSTTVNGANVHRVEEFTAALIQDASVVGFEYLPHDP
ncbi:magnesium transporter [Sphingobium quisquiliarum P25]|uniref:Protein MgtC n=1 Tax=Sphingobium quisquiliarum P25 TaxID=1329909 RepID=T0H9R2_9SPHN|nr:MgtC/SapB family protein [Sphingobium quisquiliarum]EQB08818.1 magnesium transporter [Sphingobium quisquiliarum P25]